MASTLELVLLYLVAAVAGVVVCRTLKLPPMLGYLAVGVIIGPHALALAKDSASVEYLGEFGVVFLMFVIGLEFNLPKLHSMRKLVFGLGLSQVALTIIAAVAGNSKRKVPKKATRPCHAGDGCTPVNANIHSLTGASSSAKAKLHSAIAISQTAYQRSGRRLFSARRPRLRAPSAKPPKNAATTASKAAASCPSHKAHCCVQTI